MDYFHGLCSVNTCEKSLRFVVLDPVVRQGLKACLLSFERVVKRLCEGFSPFSRPLQPC